MPVETHVETFQPRATVERWFGLEPDWFLADAEYVPGKGVRYIFHKKVVTDEYRRRYYAPREG